MIDEKDWDFEERWDAWQEKNRRAEVAFRAKARIILPILVVVGFGVYLYLTR
jgi:hypothetical protein